MIPARNAAPDPLSGTAAIRAVRRILATSAVVGIDFETSVAPAHDRVPYVLSVSGSSDVVVSLRSPGIELGEMFAEHLKLPPWERPWLVAHNAQFETEVLLKHGVALDIECTLLAAKALMLTAVPEGVPQPVEFSLAALAEREFGRHRDKTIRDRDWSRPEALDETGVQYALEDAQDTLALWRLYRHRLEADGLWRGYTVLQQAILPTASINLAGKLLDRDAHDRLCHQLLHDVTIGRTELDRICRHAVRNHGSALQVSNWIVEEVLGVRQLTPPEPPKLDRLRDLVRRRGGIRPDGETAARDIPPRMLDMHGQTHEDMTLSAWEAGFIPAPGEDRPCPDVMLDALEADCRRAGPPVVAEADQAEWDLYETERVAYEETQEALALKGLDQRRKLLGAFDKRLRARTGAGWRWTTKTANLRVDKGAMTRKPPLLRPHWPHVADYLEARARWTRSKKLHDAFGPKLREFIAADGRVRGQLRVGATVTGRHSCVSPNDQQWPALPEFRAVYRAPPGRKYVICDYGQIELRLAAIVTGDEELLRVYREGMDVHARTMEITGIAALPGLSPNEKRRRAKGINFGIIYGAGTAGLSEAIGIPVDEAEAFLQRFLRTYRGIARAREDAKHPRGQIDIRPGRRVLVSPQIEVPPTIAVNYPIQGGAASVQMRALRLTYDALGQFGAAARIVGSIHDEFILETSEGAAVAAGDVLQDCMRAALLEYYPEAAEMRAADLAEAAVVDNWSQK